MPDLRLPLPGFAFRFDLLLELSRRIAYPARFLVQDGVLHRFLAGELVSIRQARETIILSRRGQSASSDSQLIAAARQGLGLERDLSPFYAIAQLDELLWRVIKPLHGIPIANVETVFEALVTLIIEQHISWISATRAQQTLLRMAGDCETLASGIVCDFPSPAQIASLDKAELKALKITDRRSDLILRIARQVRDGELDLEALRHMEAEVAYNRLLEIKGVGHWTAANAIGRAFGDYRYVSQNDVALQAAVNHYFHAGGGEKGARQVMDTLGVYGENAGMAGHLTLLRWVLERYPATS